MTTQAMTMTAAPDWHIAGPPRSDAELALASARGDRAAFADIYDRYADRLHDFCCGMLRDRDGAADCVQDVFCIAADRMTQLREPAKLRSWLYAIARTEALRRIRERERETVYDEVPDAVCNEPGPEILAARTELADLVDEAAGGLSDRDRSVLELAYRHGLDGADLADALGVSQNSANVIVHRLRETIERALGALLVSRGVRHDPDRCAALAEILNGWDGTFTVLMRKRVARHIEGCSICEQERRRLVNPVALLGSAPVFIPAPDWLRERTLGAVDLTSSAKPLTPSKLPAALFAAALVAAVGMALIWLQQVDFAAIAPVQTTQPLPPPPVVAATSAPSPPPAPASTIVKPSPGTPLRPAIRSAIPSPPRTSPPVVDVPTPVEPPPPPPPAPPPPLPPLPPLQWPPEWQLPQWPQWPPSPPPPGGGTLTGPSRLVVDSPRPVG